MDILQKQRTEWIMGIAQGVIIIPDAMTNDVDYEYDNEESED